MALQLHLGVHEPILHPGAERLVVLDGAAVEQFRQGGFDLLVDLVERVLLGLLRVVAWY